MKRENPGVAADLYRCLEDPSRPGQELAPGLVWAKNSYVMNSCFPGTTVRKGLFNPFAVYTPGTTPLAGLAGMVRRVAGIGQPSSVIAISDAFDWGRVVGRTGVDD